MYFAFDPPSVNATGIIAAEMTSVRAGSADKQLNVAAIIDCAFDERFFRDRWRAGSRRVSLYEDTQLSGLGAAAPYLIEAPMDASELSDWLTKLVNACENRPMWSLIASPCSIEELANHFRPYLIGRTDDSLEWPIRWADTRVLPRFLDALPSDDRSSLMQVVSCWAATGRDGTPNFWYGAGKSRRPAQRFEKLLLSDPMFAQLVDAAEADAVLAKTEELQPTLLNSRLPSDCHRSVTQQLAVADQFNIQTSRARQHFSMLALLLRENFVSSPEIQALLANMRDGADYDVEISKLPDAFWNWAASNGVA